MKIKYCTAILAILIISIINAPLTADEFQYPYYLIGSHNTITECWTGIDQNGNFPLSVDPNEYLVGPPPSIEDSAVTLPTGSWVELLFRGVIYDGPKDDIFISEMDPVGEQALIFLTDGAEQEYLLAYAEVPTTNEHLPTILGFDIAGLELPFEPRAIRIVGIDLRGGSPGFDLSFANARINQDDNPKASYPYPPDKAENVPVDTVLDWIPGNYSQTYNIYFGYDISSIYPDAVPVLQTKDINSFDPQTMEMGKTYYWRIDEVNETDPNIVLKGTSWSFSVADSLVIDKFESYTTENDIETSWVLEDDGYLSVNNNSMYAHSCRQSMETEYHYSNSRRTLITKSFENAQNWIAAEAKTLELYFYGYRNNYIDCNMYIELGDGENKFKIQYPNDINDIRNERWMLWAIDLQSVGSYSDDMNQIDMAHIESFSIGFEIDPNKTNYSGYGTVYFDDIILYPSRCLPGNRPEADFNGDCIVDFKDFSELANNWLENGYKIYEVQEPNNEPILWYEFNNNLVDKMGRAHGEFINTTLNFVPGVYGNALNFDKPNSSVKVYPVSSITSNITKGITIAFWQKGVISQNQRDNIFCSEYEYNVKDPAVSINLGCWDKTGVYYWDCGTELPYDRRLSGTHKYKQEWANQWNHWAFTKDIATGTMQVYLNGALINSKTDSSKEISVFDSFTIGSGWYGDYDGLMDDLRIYDYALSQPEIAYVASNGTGIFDIPLMTPSDLNPDNLIDLKDLIILANQWLVNNSE